MEGVYYYVGGTMNDETGGKPLMGRVTFGQGRAAKQPLTEAYAALAVAMQSQMTATGHTTIPTAALTELLAAAEECAGLLEERVDADHRFHNIVPAERLMHKINSAPVCRLRAAVARVRGE